MQFTFPTYIKQVMTVLQDAGFEAYVVGGAVRDTLLGRTPEDYDIVTNARPDEIKLLAKEHNLSLVDKVGQNFGVVMLIMGKKVIEVASYRNETYGRDAHRPEEVWYCDTLEEDLGRRDFTINAMAVDLKGNITDLYEGQEDLRQGIIRTVGNAEKRFDEDALRMFRACRFVAQLDFTYDKRILKAIASNLERVEGLSLERVRVELDKLLVSVAADKGLDLMVRSGLAAQSCHYRENGRDFKVAILPELEHMVGMSQNPQFHPFDVWEHTLVALRNGDRRLESSWAILLHDVAKGMEGIRGTNEKGEPTDHGHEEKGAQMALDILTRLRFPKELAQRVSWVVGNHMRFGANIDAADDVTWRWLRKCARSGEFRENKVMAEAFKQLTNMCIADMVATTASKQELISAQMYGTKLVTMAYLVPIHTTDLNISGKDLLPEGFTKEELETVMPVLLRRVQDGELKNDYEVLERAAKIWKVRQEKKSQV